MRCQRGQLAIEAGETWQRLTISLERPAIPAEGGRWRATLLSLYLPDPESEAEIRSVALDGAIRNGNFADGLARWYPLARDDFLPWHIDSLPLELVIERGVLGLLSFALLAACAMRGLFATRNRGLTAAPVLAASLLGALLVGLVSSLLDSPRVAFLLLYLIALSLAWCEAAEPVHET
jgi:hypothetical protein